MHTLNKSKLPHQAAQIQSLSAAIANPEIIQKILSSYNIVGPAEGKKIVAKQLLRRLQLEKLMQQFRGNVKSTPVDDEKLSQQLENSLQFLSTRYQKLGISLPSIILFNGLIGADARRSLGEGYTNNRSFSLGLGSEIPELEIQSLAVHEMSHVTGYVEYRDR